MTRGNIREYTEAVPGRYMDGEDEQRELRGMMKREVYLYKADFWG